MGPHHKYALEICVTIWLLARLTCLLTLKQKFHYSWMLNCKCFTWTIKCIRFNLPITFWPWSSIIYRFQCNMERCQWNFNWPIRSITFDFRCCQIALFPERFMCATWNEHTCNVILFHQHRQQVRIQCHQYPDQFHQLPVQFCHSCRLFQIQKLLSRMRRTQPFFSRLESVKLHLWYPNQVIRHRRYHRWT